MEEDRSFGSGGGYKWISKRTWDMMNDIQPGTAGQWQEQGKKLCLSDVYEITNPNIPLAMITPLPPSNAPSNPPGLVASSLNFSRSETSDNFGTNVNSGASPMISQVFPYSRVDHSLQSVSYLSSSFDAANNSEESWNLDVPAEALEPFLDFSEVGSMPRSGSFMGDNYMLDPNNHQTPPTYLNLGGIDFPGLPSINGHWIQQSGLGNDLPARPVGFSDIESLYLPLGASSWSQPSLPNVQEPQLQPRPGFLEWSDSLDASGAQFFNQDSLLRRDLSRDDNVHMDYKITSESEDSKPFLLQKQKMDSPSCDSQFSSTSDTDDQMSCSNRETSKIVSTTPVNEFNYPSRAEIFLSTKLKDGVLQNGLTEDCSLFHTGSAGSEGTSYSEIFEQGEGAREVGYDTCFGTIRTSPVKLQSSLLGAKSAVDQDVTLKIYNGMVMVYQTQTMRYKGLLDHGTGHVLRALSRNYSVTFKAYLDVETFSSKESTKIGCRSLQVILYGLHRDSDAIGTLLSNHNFYLQQPTTFDSSVAYFNPQYLLRPGSEFKVVAQEDLPDTIQEKKMAQTIRSQMLRIFDTALGPTSFSEVQVSKRLTTDLKSYQKKALALMAEKESGVIENPVFPALWVPKTLEGGSKRYLNSVTGHSQYHTPLLCLGGLLADEMGLGKTLTMLALIAGTLDYLDDMNSLSTNSLDSSSVVHSPNTTLIVTPLSTLPGWEEQIRKHLEPRSIKFLLYHGAEREQHALNILQNDVVITTYDTLRAECPIHSKRKSKRSGLLHSIDWHRVVLDEAHVIRNRSSQVFNSVDTLQARHRWCLTGTPIQNGIEDFGALISFLRVYPFDNPVQFRTHLVNPIHKGESFGIEKLKSLVQAISLRRTKQSVFGELRLGPRIERVESIQLNEEERTIYTIVKKSRTYTTKNSGSVGGIFRTITKLRQVCNHGRELLCPATLAVLDHDYKNNGAPIAEELQSCENCGIVVQDSGSDEISDYLLPCWHIVCYKCSPKRSADKANEELCPVCSYNGTSDSFLEDEQATSSFPDLPHGVMDVDSSYRPSSKVSALLQNLRVDRLVSAKDPIKSVVFTSWTGMLDLIEKALVAERIVFERIDGGKSLHHRRQAIQSFRSNPLCTVLIASIGSAGVGLDLTVASRVHLLEPQWNPMAEEQALDRVHRLGQTREVITIRYIVKDSIEEYILQTQNTKLSLIQASFGDESLSRANIMEERLKNLNAALK